MIYAIIKDTFQDITLFKEYTNTPDYFRDVFPPDILTEWIIDTNKPPFGNTYKGKKNVLRKKAIDYSNLIDSCEYQSLSAIIEIQIYFNKYGKRYGLTKEFRENGII